MLSDNIDRATQKFFQVCFQTDYQEKLRGHFYIDIYIAAIVVLVSCYRTKEAQGGDAEGVLQFFGMRCDEGYVFFSCFHFYYSFIFNAFALTGRKADCAYTQSVTLG